MKKRVLSLLLALVMCLSLGVPVWAANHSVGLENRIAIEPVFVLQEKDFYTEATHSEGEGALSSISSEKVRDEIKNYLTENELTLISVSSKSIYFREESLEDGSVICIPMTKSEMLAEQMLLGNTVEPRAIVNPEPKEYGKLTITLTVSNNARHQIWIDTRADWDSPELYGEDKLQPAGGDDKYALTWGASNTLSASSAACSGNYRNGQAIAPIREQSGALGVCQWRFAERSSSGSGAEKIYSTVVLSPSTAYQGNVTWCEFTYTHNYYLSLNQLLEWEISIAATGLPY